MSETVLAERWLKSVLGSDTQLTSLVSTRIYSYIVPDGTTAPYVVYYYVDGMDENGIGVERIYSTLQYGVKAVGAGESLVALESIANRIDAVLHGASGAITGGGNVVECLRIRPVSMAEVIEGGQQYRHLGGIYQLRVQEA